MSVRSRHLRFQRRVSLLAIIALLWSQLALAGHAACWSGDAHGMVPAAETSQSEHCGDAAPDTDVSLCQLHCSRADLHSDMAPALSVPPLGLAWRLEWHAVTPASAKHASRSDVLRPPSWHRPTAHPASLLLI